MQMNDNNEPDNKNAKNKNNPFEVLEETIAREIQRVHPDVFNNLRVEKKFIYTFFKNCTTPFITEISLGYTLEIINETVSYFNHFKHFNHFNHFRLNNTSTFFMNRSTNMSHSSYLYLEHTSSSTLKTLK